MNENIFREYDIRGIVGTDLIISNCYALGKALAVFLRKQDPKFSTILIGRDGRTHSPAITNELISAFIDSGIDVIDLGLIPTPCLYFAVNTLNIPHGLIVTASHNPQEYNGIKMWNIAGSEIQEIKKLFIEKQSLSSEHKGVISCYDINSDYITFLTNHFAHLRGITVNTVIDCGNGSAGIVMKRLLDSLQLKNTHLIFDDVDGTFPNHEADPTVPENMTWVNDILEKEASYALGIGFDGDADRMNPMTKQGFLVPGDQLLALYAQHIVHNYHQPRVIFDIKSSSGLSELLEKWQAIPIMSPSGHSFIKRAIKEHNALLGGELSCHFFFNDRYFGYDDGIYAALRLIELVHETKQSLEQLLTIFPKKIASREFRISCGTDARKSGIIDGIVKHFADKDGIRCITIDGIRAETDTGWGLARASNTQPVICLRFEATTHAEFTAIKQDFYNALVPHFDAQQLKDTIGLP